MKIFHQTKKIFVAAFSALILAVVGVSPVFADEIPEYRIQMSPAKEDIGELKPGETYTGTFKVQNTGSKKFDFKVGVSPYTVQDEHYSPNYDVNNQFTDIVNWIKFSNDTGTVEPNGEVEVSYEVKVPVDVPAGGQYAILTAETINEKNTSNNSGIVAVRRVGMLLYSNVEGNTRKTGSIEENKISSILFHPPISATSIVKNTGNTHATAKYVLQVYPLFGGEEIYTNEENPMTLTILPETRRYNSVDWEGAPHLGIFRVKQTITMFDQTSTTEKIVVLIPLWFLFIILILIFCVIFWIITRIRNRNKYN